MCTGITVTRQYIPLSWRIMNKAGSNIVALAVVTMETLPAFLRNQGISKRTVFFKDGLAKYDVSARGLFVVSTFSSIFPSML